MTDKHATRPTALVTNDDGIDSYFLKALVQALDRHFDVTVVAPDGERSWAGRSFSRMHPITVARHDGEDNWWSISGSPTDCVNIGMHHLMKQPPDVVVSGINLGFNMSLPLVLTSGTVSAALEGALNGVHAVASSLHIPSEQFEATKATNGRVEGTLADALHRAADMTADYALSLVNTSVTGTIVHNMNFPAAAGSNTPLETVTLSNLRLGSMYEPTSEGIFEFRFPETRAPVYMPEHSDLSALERGHASITQLNYDCLGRA